MISMGSLVDTHAHICDSAFDKDRADVLARARRAGVHAVVAIGETLADARRNLELSAVNSMLRPAAGLYPTHLDPGAAEDMAAFIRLNHARLAAIGEVGLDYWAVQHESGKAIQRQIFKMFIELSKALRIPLNVHSRSAGRHAIAMLLEHDAPLVQMHAYDGKAGSALPAVEAGYYFSIPPSIVRSRQKQKLVRLLPVSALLVESDSPVLGPDPGERNEPANIAVAVAAIARIKSLSEERVRRELLQNTERLYGPMVI